MGQPGNRQKRRHSKNTKVCSGTGISLDCIPEELFQDAVREVHGLGPLELVKLDGGAGAGVCHVLGGRLGGVDGLRNLKSLHGDVYRGGTGLGGQGDLGGHVEGLRESGGGSEGSRRAKTWRNALSY